MNKSDIRRIIREGFQSSAMNENEKNSKRYMFRSNLEQMCRQAELLMKEDDKTIDSILDDGHDWAADHVATAKESLDQVFDFMMNMLNKKDDLDIESEDSEEEIDEGIGTGTSFAVRNKAPRKKEEELEEGSSRSQTNFRGKNKKPANYPWIKK